MGHSKITILSLFLPAVFAVPHQPRHGHRSGTAHHSTATYHAGNATSYGPTGYWTGTSVYAYSTVTVVPLSATDSSSTLPTFTSVSIPSSLSESSIVEALTSGSTSPCSSPTVTITSSGLVTITVTSSDSAAAGQSTSSQIDLTNSTSSLPSSFVYQSIGTTDTSETTSSAVPSSIPPSYTAESSTSQFYSAQSSATSINAAQSSASIVTSSASQKGYSNVPLPASSAASFTPMSSQADTVSVSSPTSSTTSATGTTAAVVASSLPYVTTTPIAGSVPSNGKRGLAYSIGEAAYATHYSTASAIPWAYNWEASRESELPSHIEFVPMLHGPDDSRTSAWPAAATKAINAGSKHVMNVNEPDQNKWTPASIAKLHNGVMNPLSDGGKIRIGSPGVTQGTGPGVGNDVGWGTTWLQDFKNECGSFQGGCTVDFVPVHWYLHIDSTCRNKTIEGCVADFVDYVDATVTAVQKIWPGVGLWLDEFQVWNANVEQQKQFLGTVLPFLDGHTGIERYSYFQLAPYDPQSSQYHMIGSDNQLNDVGKAYMA